MLAVEPLVVRQQEGIVGGELGAAHDAVGHGLQGDVEQNAEHPHAHHEGAEAWIAAVHPDGVAAGQHDCHGRHRIAQGGLVQPLAVSAGAERTAQGLDADDAGETGNIRSMAMRSA